MSTPIISVENLSKAYRIGLKEDIPDTFVAAMTGWLKAPLRNWRRLRRLNTFGEQPVVSAVAGEDGGLRMEDGKNGHPTGNGHPPSSILHPHANNQPQENADTLWALRNVSFEVNEGEVVGIIGRNGAGKSTLLKILSRITEPTHGRAVIRGRVSSLLEVGTGFHPELTGRENIYMNGTILGMRKREIDRKFDEIVDFSGVEKFLDTPIKRYSSGMQVRLAFAVAAHLEPEILIIDEVLAVGDAEFQKKCLGKMQDVARGGRTVLFVSHNMAAVQQLCGSALLVCEGTILHSGPVNSVVRHYLHGDTAPNGAQVTIRMHSGNEREPLRVTNFVARPADHIGVHPRSGTSAEFIISYEYDSSRGTRIPSLRAAVRVTDLAGMPLFSCATGVSKTEFIDAAPIGQLLCRMSMLPLLPGRYLVDIKLRHSATDNGYWAASSQFDVVDSGEHGLAHLPQHSAGCLLVAHSWDLCTDASTVYSSLAAS